MAQSIQQAAVIGAGVMGQGIAQVLAQAGIETRLYDLDPEAPERARAAMSATLDKRVAKGKLSTDERDAVLERVVPVTSLEALAGSDLVVEAVVEKLALKHDLVRRLEAILGADALIVTNTSSLSVTGIAEVAEHPHRVAGWHFFNPAPVMKLVEVVRGRATSDATVERLVETAQALGKTPVTVRDSPGFIVNRCARPFYSEALALFEAEVAGVEVIDASLKSNAGVPLGPFELMDLVGLDVSLAATETIWQAFDQAPRFKPSLAVQRRVEAGELGRKASSGFYSYPHEAPAERPATELSGARDLAERLYQTLHIPVRVSDGCTAEEAATINGGRVLCLDQTLVPWSNQPVTLAYSAYGVTEADCRRAEHCASELGVTLVPVTDSPGLIVQRVATMLHDEAQRTVADDVVAAPEEIDTALRGGLNFTAGPFALSAELTDTVLCRVLQRLAHQDTSGRYSFPTQPVE